MDLISQQMPKPLDLDFPSASENRQTYELFMRNVLLLKLGGNVDPRVAKHFKLLLASCVGHGQRSRPTWGDVVTEMQVAMRQVAGGTGRNLDFEIPNAVLEEDMAEITGKRFLHTTRTLW